MQPTIPKISYMHLHHLQMFYHVSTYASVHFWIPYTSCKIFTKPLQIYNSSFRHLFNTLFTSPQDPHIFILQKIMHRHMLQYSSAPINLAFLFTTLKFSIKYGSIAKDSYSPPPFSKINTWFSFNFTWLIYILFLSPFAFLFFSSYFFYVSCFGSFCSHSYHSDYYFWIFLNICTFIYL